MIVPVLMLAFNQLPVIRQVSVDESDSKCAQPLNMLAAVVHFGQNEVIPMDEMPSVSVGDVILLDDKPWMVDTVGFHRLDVLELLLYISIKRELRKFLGFVK